MKKILLLAVMLLPCMLSAQSIRALYAFRTYALPDRESYVEINTSVDASSLSLLTDESTGKYYKQAELTTVIALSDRPDSAVYVDKRIVSAPKVSSESELKNISMLDLQRVPLANGTYIAYFTLKDPNQNEALQYSDAFKIEYFPTQVAVSDIMIIESLSKAKKVGQYTKSGYDMVPYLFDKIDKDNNKLNYYLEVYNADKEFGADVDYAIVSCIEDINTEKKVESIQKIKKEKAKSITPYIGALDISSLCQGSYWLTVEVRNANNMLYAYKRYPFFKDSDSIRDVNNLDIPANAFVNTIPEEDLTENVKCLAPLAAEYQLQFIRKNVKDATPAQKRYFLYQFWKGENMDNPEKAWKEYMAKVDFVNRNYATKIKKGYETDMGRVYLVYGAPDELIDEKFGASSGLQRRSAVDKAMDPYAPDVDADGVNYYPYQIWRYNFTPFGEANRGFVFYAKQDNMAEYFLLHSNAKGELQDIYWERTLSKNTLDEGVEGKAGKQFRTGHL